MKKAIILLSFVFLIVALAGCSQTKDPSYQSQVDALNAEMNSALMAEQEFDVVLTGLEDENFLSTDDFDSEFDNAVSDELKIDEELFKLETMDF